MNFHTFSTCHLVDGKTAERKDRLLLTAHSNSGKPKTISSEKLKKSPIDRNPSNAPSNAILVYPLLNGDSNAINVSNRIGERTNKLNDISSFTNFGVCYFFVKQSFPLGVDCRPLVSAGWNCSVAAYFMYLLWYLFLAVHCLCRRCNRKPGIRLWIHQPEGYLMSKVSKSLGSKCGGGLKSWCLLYFFGEGWWV